MNALLVVHNQNQDTEFDFWRIVVPENDEIKENIVRELHSTPYSAHPGIQRTIARVRRLFFWKGMLGTSGSLLKTAQCVRWKNLTTL